MQIIEKTKKRRKTGASRRIPERRSRVKEHKPKTHTKSLGIPMRFINIALAALGGVLALILLIVNLRTTAVYEEMEEATTRYEVCNECASDMQEASDFLTDRVRSFAMTGEISYIDDYFAEVNDTRRREKSQEKLARYFKDTEFNSYLANAMDFSLSLQELEEYAIRLTAEGYGIDLSDFPRAIQKTELSAEDREMTPEEKIAAARDSLFGEIYRSHKDEISLYLNSFTVKLMEYTRTQQTDTADNFRHYLRLQFFLLGALIFVIFLTLLLIAFLVVRPLGKSSNSIRRSEKLPVAGCREMQILAESYNAMYDQSRAEQIQLTYEAEHDALTGLYNRGVFDRLCRTVNNSAPTAIVLIDIDHFKQFNDTYGHQTGDEILKRVAWQLKSSFRSNDYVCRIGGDEFVVIMANAAPDSKNLLKNKIGAITHNLAREENDLPGVTLSIGVAFGEKCCDMEKLYKNADIALYQVKNAGRNGLKFF